VNGRKASVSLSRGFQEPLGRGAFTLVELLIVIAVVAVLAALILPALAGAKAKAGIIGCLNNMRQISLATRLYADENSDEMPRSQHSAFAHGQPTWGRAIANQLGASGPTWTNLLKGVYRCPKERQAGSRGYGLNVYFELGPEDDYRGKPMTWRRIVSVPSPTSTIQFAESATGADHIMAHFWISSSDAMDVDSLRHRDRSNYSFVDGHGESRKIEATFKPDRPLDLWNPSKAD
jgi:prepilin-type N-terminal cleavage/methylation domain-containing protein/prepilin-type processing-associated H-X9-DG protein